MTTHLDMTTVLSAGRALDAARVQKAGLPLTNLLSLSQLVEAIVLHEDLQYEGGSSPDYEPYLEEVSKSVIGQMARHRELPLRRTDDQCDESESQIISALRWAAQAIPRMDSEVLRQSVLSRKDAYKGIPQIDDEKNPVLRKYVDIANAQPDASLIEGVDHAIKHLRANLIGSLGLHVMVRINLLTQWLGNGGVAYAPHFSRHGLIACSSSAQTSVQHWTMEQLHAAREEILDEIEPKVDVDALAGRLSPIFLACLFRARTPRDLLQHAIALRASEPARNYRQELNDWLSNRPEEDVLRARLYKKRLKDHLNDLGDFLFEQGTTAEERTSHILTIPKSFPYTWTQAIIEGTKTPRFASDRAVIFLSNILKLSLGIANAQGRIEEVFGVCASYDTSLLGLKRPSPLTL